MVLSDAWLAGGFASKGGCILEPADAPGKVMRSAGPAFEQMLAAAGASINSMPSSEIYTGLQTGVLDAVNTSSGSFVSFRIYEQVDCLTPPGDYALWFMYEPILMSKDELRGSSRPSSSRRCSMPARRPRTSSSRRPRGSTRSWSQTFEQAGVEVAGMSQEQFNAWLDLAKDSSYKIFAEEVPGGDQLIEKALAVE